LVQAYIGWERSYAYEKIITLEELLRRFRARFTYHAEIKACQLQERNPQQG